MVKNLKKIFLFTYHIATLFTYIISKKQEQFSSVSFQDMTSNVNLHAEPFLDFFCRMADCTKSNAKSCKIGPHIEVYV